MPTLDQNREKTYYKLIFYAAMVISIVCMFCVLLATNGQARLALFYNPSAETFMDFFNSVVNTAVDPYAEGYVIYPPICILFFRLFLRFIPADVFHLAVTDAAAAVQPKDIKLYEGFWFAFIFYSIIILLLFLFAVEQYKKGKIAERILFVSVTLMSSPVLLLIERGNILFLTLILTILFFLWFESENKVLREISLICLAIAFSIKFYPLIFAIFLLRQKRWKEILRLAIYCFILLFVPFFLAVDGLNSIPQFLKHMSRVTTSRLARGFDQQLNYAKFFRFIASLFQARINDVMGAANIFSYVLTALSAVALFTLKERWKITMLCACLIAGFPAISYTYGLVFFIIPIIMFLDGNVKSSKLNYAYLILMTAMMVLKPLPNLSTGSWNQFTSTKIDSFAFLALTIMAIVEGLRPLFEKLSAKTGLRIRTYAKAIVICIVALIVSGLLFSPKLIGGGAYVYTSTQYIYTSDYEKLSAAIQSEIKKTVAVLPDGTEMPPALHRVIDYDDLEVQSVEYKIRHGAETKIKDPLQYYVIRLDSGDMNTTVRFLLANGDRKPTVGIYWDDSIGAEFEWSSERFYSKKMSTGLQRFSYEITDPDVRQILVYVWDLDARVINPQVYLTDNEIYPIDSGSLLDFNYVNEDTEQKLLLYPTAGEQYDVRINGVEVPKDYIQNNERGFDYLLLDQDVDTVTIHYPALNLTTALTASIISVTIIVLLVLIYRKKRSVCKEAAP